jgi:Fanconi anemia group J protein
MRQRVVYDLEDLMSAGTAVEGCPYYASRDIQEGATLTLCPYNYLLDPSIRKACGFDLHNAVLVFDEAHNIEDSCREAARWVAACAPVNA